MSPNPNGRPPPPRRTGGYSITELMVGLTILGIIFALAPRILIDTYRFIRLSIARTEIQRDARMSIDLINRRLRQARAHTVVVDRHSAAQPPYSKVTFQTVSGSTMTFWQEGRSLKIQEEPDPGRVLAGSLRHLVFAYSRTDNDNIMGVSLAFEREIYAGKSKALQMAVEKVRIMNE
jgi:type II secretory pathway pseudopilin PulG